MICPSFPSQPWCQAVQLCAAVCWLATSANALADIPPRLKDDPQALKKYFDELFKIDFRRATDELDNLDGDLENQLRRMWGKEGLSDVPGPDDDIAPAPTNALADLRMADGIVGVTIPVDGGYGFGDGGEWADDIGSAFDSPALGRYPLVSSANQQLTVGQLVTDLTAGVDNDTFNDKFLPPDVIEALVIYRDLRVVDLIQSKLKLGRFVVSETGATTAGTLLSRDVGEGLARVLEINRELADMQDLIDAGEATAESTQGIRTALTTERDKLLDTPGQADSPALREARADYQNELTQLAYGLNGLNQNFLNAQNAFRQADSALATFLAGEWQSVISMPPNLQSPFREKKARLEADRSAALAEMTAAKFEYVAALSGQPLLNQTIKTSSFEGPYWQQINLFGNNDAAFDLAVSGLLSVYDNEIARVGETDAASDLMNEVGSVVYSPFRAASAAKMRYWFPDIDLVNQRIGAIYAELISDEEYWDNMLGKGLEAITVVLLGLALLTPPGMLVAGGALASTYTALGFAVGAEAIALQSMRVNRANMRLEQAQQAQAAGGGLNTTEIQRLEAYLGESKEKLFIEIATTAAGAVADTVFRSIKLGKAASTSADSADEVLTAGRRSRQILTGSERAGPGSTRRLAAGELPADQRLGGTQRLSPEELPLDQRVGGTQRLSPDELPPAGSGDNTIPPTTPPGSSAGLGDGQSATYRSNAGAAGSAADEFPPPLKPGDNLTPSQPPVGGDIRVSNPLRYAGEPGSARRMYSEMDQNLVVKADRLIDGDYGPLRLEHFDYEVITYGEFERLEDIVTGNKPWTGPGALTQQQFKQLEALYDAGNRLDLRAKLIQEVQIGGVFDEALANANIGGLTGQARYADELAEGVVDDVGAGLADASRTDFGQLRAPSLEGAGATIPPTRKPQPAGGSGYSCRPDNPGDAVRGGQPIETPTGLYVEFDASLDVLDFDADGFPLRIQGQNGQVIEFVTTPQGPWPPVLGTADDFVWPNPIQTADGLYIEFVVTTKGVTPRIGETPTQLFVDILDPAYGAKPTSPDWLLDSLTGSPVKPGVSCVPEISTDVGGDVLAANPFWPPPRLGSPAALASELDLSLVSKTSRMVRQSGGNIQRAYFDGGSPGSWWTDAELERLDELVNNPGRWAGQGPLRTADLENLRAVNDAAQALGIGPAVNGPGPFWNWGGLGTVPLVGVFELDEFLADIDSAGTQALLDRAGSFVLGDKVVLDFLANDSELKQIEGLLNATPGFLFHEINPGRNKQQTSDDPYFNSQGSWQQPYADQWAIKQVGYTAANNSAWNTAGATSDIVIAVIDTGLAWNHPDLPADLLWNNADEIPANGIDDDANGYIDDTLGYDFVARQNVPWDFDGHGTFVTGVIAASRNNGVGIAGIAPNAKIMVLKALDGVGYTRASRLAEAIVYAADNGAQIINISSGGSTKSRVEQLAIDYAHANGALVVIAAGNGGTELAAYGPAGANHAMTVAASDPGDAVPPFSNRGPRVSLAAPGVDILSLRAARTDLAYGVNGYPRNYRAADDFVGADRSYYRATGTSFAAPIVSATAALIWANKPALSNVEVTRMIQQSAADISTPGVDNSSGYGRLDAAAALRANPEFFVDAQIESIAAVQKDGAAYAQIRGTANADKFDSAWIEYGRGTSPEKWTRAKGKLQQAVSNDSLGTIQAAKLSGAAQWTVRLMVKHKTGQIREARYVINLN